MRMEAVAVNRWIIAILAAGVLAAAALWFWPDQPAGPTARRADPAEETCRKLAGRMLKDIGCVIRTAGPALDGETDPPMQARRCDPPTHQRVGDPGTCAGDPPAATGR